MTTRTQRQALDGLVFPEVPRWKNGELWLCDFQVWVPGASGQVLAVGRDGEARTIIDQVPGGPANGLAWLPDGRLLITTGKVPAVLALGVDGVLTRYADLSGLTSYGCNEIAVDSAGRAYVGTCKVPPDPQVHSEVLLVQPNGRGAEVADTTMRFPNGFMITPDGGTLIVAESTGHCLSSFSIDDDGSLHGKRVWAALPDMVPDGPCLDQEGCVWVADAIGKACVRVAEGGTIVDRIETEQDAFACTLGGDNGRRLYIATSVNPFTGARPSGRPGKVIAVDL